MNIYINMHYTNVLPRTGGMVIWRREECGMCLYITSFQDTCYVKKTECIMSAVISSCKLLTEFNIKR